MTHWGKHFENYDLFMNNFSSYRDTIRFHVLQHKNSEFILDDGCGTGNLALALLSEGHKVSAIDPELAAVRLVAAKSAAYIRELDARQMNGLDLRYENNSFDGVSSMFVIPFVEDSRKYMSEIFRVLKQGGKAVISAWAPQPDILAHLVGRMEDEFKLDGVLPKYQSNWDEFLKTSKVNTGSVTSSYNTVNLPSDIKELGFVNVEMHKQNPYGEYAFFITCEKPNKM